MTLKCSWMKMKEIKKCKTLPKCPCTKYRNICFVRQKSKEERELKTSLEIITKEKQDEHSKYEELLIKKDQELKKLNALCKSLEKLMNEKSAAEKEVREKVTDKDHQLKVVMFIYDQMVLPLWFANNLYFVVEFGRHSERYKSRVWQT